MNEITGHQSLVESHPLEPFLPRNGKILMLESFPPSRKRWSMDFYYPNLQNDMWRIFGLLFFQDKEYFLADGRKAFDEGRIRMFLTEKGIALSDAAREIIRQQGNASDQFLEVVSPIDLRATLLHLPECRAIVTTGQKATDTLLTLITAEQPNVGDFSGFSFAGREMKLYRMPSSSRAYPKPLQEKASVYEKMFRAEGVLG